MDIEETVFEETAPEEAAEHVLDNVPEQEDENGQPALEDWTVASLAHASVLLGLVFSVAGGVGALIGPVVALAIYMGYREKSRFVAFQALQACAYQAAGLLLYVVLAAVLAAGVTVAWTVSGVLAAVLIGFLLMPFALALTLVMVVVLVGAPLAWIGYGLYAAYLTYQGQDFRYWLIGERLEEEVKF
jgi:uncharacterized protein